jgi:hypothetical protein
MDNGNILGETVPSLSRFQENLTIPYCENASRTAQASKFGREVRQIEGNAVSQPSLFEDYLYGPNFVCP